MEEQSLMTYLKKPLDAGPMITITGLQIWKGAGKQLVQTAGVLPIARHHCSNLSTSESCTKYAVTISAARPAFSLRSCTYPIFIGLLFNMHLQLSNAAFNLGELFALCSCRSAVSFTIVIAQVFTWLQTKQPISFSS